MGEQLSSIRIEDEIKQSYLDYAMSVIIGRALPDVRDGLKPVHRRILYAMRELGNDYNKPYKKAARIVGDVIGKFHPHGDAAVYEALVRMAQDFSMRYPLVDGQGNFGSVDGDPPAAMRYTEVRLSKLSQEFLKDLDKETVDFVSNYDGSLFEPSVLPTVVPNLLVNGSAGIAVGMAANIPPHNLSEVIDALLAMIDEPDIELDALMEYIPGPDFPTAATIYGMRGIREAYRTGKGLIKVRAQTEVEETRVGRQRIVVTELPFQVNKAKLLERIADLLKQKKIEGIRDIRDESDRRGMRVVIELKRDEQPEVILNNLYRHTQMEATFGINMLAIVHNRPELLSLRDILAHFLEHRRGVVLRRTAFELRKAEERAHILEGLKIALENIDAIIELIKRAENPKAAKGQLQERYGFSDAQAQAILDMRLQRLTGLERERIIEEHKNLLQEIARLRGILDNQEVLNAEIRQELHQLKEQYGDSRRTRIVQQTQELELIDYIAEEDVIVTVSHAGYIKRTPASTYRSQRRGGKGRTGTRPRQEDFVETLFVASTHDHLLFFTSLGRLHWLRVYQIPPASPLARGKAVVNLLQLRPDERVATILPVREFAASTYVVMATRRGVVKKTDLMAFRNPRVGGIIAVKISEDDELISARLTHGNEQLFLMTQAGKALRFPENEIRPMGRAARGVRGMDVNGSALVGMEVVNNEATILTVTENGFGKRTPTTAYPLRRRAGKGVLTIRTSKRNGMVVGFRQVNDLDEIMLITDRGRIIRMRVNEISVIGRITQGVRLIDIEAGEKVVDLTCLAEVEDGQQGAERN
ncbi:MAG: DNA gyrase subunit A [Deltaproteobacteria bacterium]|nr:DNA gyrase subunit A [Deltaproteobacteria bacterium]MBW2071367.1 DNA gyrase subunit A [Deltaproteobacteria bacterium]